MPSAPSAVDEEEATEPREPPHPAGHHGAVTEGGTARPANVTLQDLQQLMSLQAQLVGLQAAAGAAGHIGAASAVMQQPVAAAIQQQQQQLVPQQAVAAVPQLILAGGQIAQGIQGAQLIIPTSHGVTVQPIITMPASQAAAGGLAQLCLAGGHVFAATAANLQALVAPAAQPPPPPPPPPTILTGLSGLTPSGQPVALAAPPAGQAAAAGPIRSVAAQPASCGGRLTAVQCSAPQPYPAGPVPDRSAEDAGSTDSDSQDPFKDAADQPTISQAAVNVVDGINLEEVKEFARAFKMRRLSLGLTQTQVGQALSVSVGPAYSQSAICRFEKLDITPKSAQKIKPILEKWMREAEERHRLGARGLVEFCGTELSKKRKRRTSFTPQALEALNAHFKRNTHPSGQEITHLAGCLGYEREVVRIWFCNKRQALKNTVRLMARPPPSSGAASDAGYLAVPPQKPPMKAV